MHSVMGLEQKSQAPVLPLGLKPCDQTAELAVEVATLISSRRGSWNALGIQIFQLFNYGIKIKRNRAIYGKVIQDIGMTAGVFQIGTLRLDNAVAS